MELLIVLAIVGIVSAVGVAMVGNRQAGSVRSLMNELEGVLANAHKATVATGRDVAIINWGTWADGEGRLVIAHGDAAIPDADLQSAAKGLLLGTQPPTTLAYGQTVAVPFQFQTADPTQARARIAVVGTTDWADAMRPTDSGATNQDITMVSPFKSGETMAGLITDANNFFNAVLQRTEISGSNKRFNSTFFIQVVGSLPSGGVLPGSPMGLIVVQGNGASVYRFYNPGSRDGDGQWRRI